MFLLKTAFISILAATSFAANTVERIVALDGNGVEALEAENIATWPAVMYDGS